MTESEIASAVLDYAQAFHLIADGQAFSGLGSTDDVNDAEDALTGILGKVKALVA